MKVIYTDGACTGNPGPGGWAVIVTEDHQIIEKWGGYVRQTTNNRMELRAVIEALQYLYSDEPATIYTDSEYVLKGITAWINRWKSNGWKTADKNPVKNQDLWRVLDRYNNAGIRWIHVAGHRGDLLNEACDRLAKGFIKVNQKLTAQTNSNQPAEPLTKDGSDDNLKPIE